MYVWTVAFLIQILFILRYSFIEIIINFAEDLYPFYPPIVTITRPRLKGLAFAKMSSMRFIFETLLLVICPLRNKCIFHGHVSCFGHKYLLSTHSFHILLTYCAVFIITSQLATIYNISPDRMSCPTCDNLIFN